jgi:hypothetical protein
MKPYLLIGFLVLLSATALQAAPALEGTADKKSSSDYDTVDLQGCLQRSQGRYILVDKENTYERLSDTSKLSKLVGHEIKVVGKRTIRTVDTTQPGIASSATELRYIDVKSVTDVAPNCQDYGR